MNHRDKLVDAIFLAGAGFSGFMGFCIGLVTVLQVTGTSPLTHNISGTAKAAVQSMFASIFGEIPRRREVLSVYFLYSLVVVCTRTSVPARVLCHKERRLKSQKFQAGLENASHEGNLVVIVYLW